MGSNKNKIAFRFLASQGYRFPDIIRFLLKAKGISQTDIARRAEVKRPFVWQVLTARRDSKKVKRAISKALGFNPWSSP